MGGGVSYSVAVAGRLPVAQQRGWEGRVLGATRRRTCSAVEAPGTVWPPACRRKSQPQSPLRTSAALCIVSLERDGEGNFCRVGVYSDSDRAATGGGRRCKPQCVGLCVRES